MKLQIRSGGFTRHAEILLRKISEQIPVAESADGIVIELGLDAAEWAKENGVDKSTPDGEIIELLTELED